MIYLEDLKLFFEDSAHDNVRISPSGYQDDSRVQTANGPYISLVLEDNPSRGWAYVQCTPERSSDRFQIHHTSLKPGAEDIQENLQIEETIVCEKEEIVADNLRKLTTWQGSLLASARRR
jgi:hypothetical protein